MVDHILKISRAGVSDSCVNWNYCVQEKCPIERRRYKSRHLIPLFIGTPFIYLQHDDQKALELF